MRGNVVAGTDAEIETEELGVGNRCARGMHELTVAEPARFDCVRERQCDDSECEAAEP